MTRGPSGFEATVRVPWSKKTVYKFVVDGRWETNGKSRTERDAYGNLNNVYYAPTKPTKPTIINELPVAVIAPPHSPQDKIPEPPVTIEETSVPEPIEYGTPVVPAAQEEEVILHQAETPAEEVSPELEVRVC